MIVIAKMKPVIWISDWYRCKILNDAWCITNWFPIMNSRQKHMNYEVLCIAYYLMESFGLDLFMLLDSAPCRKKARQMSGKTIEPKIQILAQCWHKPAGNSRKCKVNLMLRLPLKWSTEDCCSSNPISVFPVLRKEVVEAIAGEIQPKRPLKICSSFQ